MIPLLYSLHSGNLFGTERMALATAEGLRDEFETIFIAPPGPVHAEASRLRWKSLEYRSASQYARDIRPFFARHKRLAAIGTRVLHSAVCASLGKLYRSELANLHVVHGGTDEKLSYARKRWLGWLGTKQVAVSDYVKERLTANGSRNQSIVVVENFLSQERVDPDSHRPVFDRRGLRRVAIVSRLDPIKRVDMLFEALELDRSLGRIQFDIYGCGMEEEVLRARALAGHSNVHFHGFRADIAERLTEADLLVHLCPVEPFGLVILEAMAARVPVLVPDEGGAGCIVQHGHNGFRFRANDAWDLARQLHFIEQTPIQKIRAVVDEGTRSLRTRFSSECGRAQYRKIITECWA